MTYQEAKQHLARKLNLTYTDVVAGKNDLWTETDLGVYVQLGIIKAWDYKFWDFAEGSKTAATSALGVTNGYYDYPQDLQSGSITLLRVDNEEYRPLLFKDYLRYLQDTPSTTDKIWSEFKRFIFINPAAYTAGDQMDLYGKLMPPVMVNDADLLPFSPDTDNYEHSGNEAVVQLGYAEALDSEKKKEYSQAEAVRKKAYQALDILWRPFADQRANLEIIRPMFDVPDFLSANKNSSQNIGNFNL